MAPKNPLRTVNSSSRSVRRAGLLVLLIGLAVAAAVGFTARQAEFEDDIGQHEASAIARIGGTATVRAAQLDQWLGSLWHGRRLAWTIATLSLIICGGCFYIAGLMDEDFDDGDGEGPPR